MIEGRPLVAVDCCIFWRQAGHWRPVVADKFERWNFEQPIKNVLYFPHVRRKYLFISEIKLVSHYFLSYSRAGAEIRPWVRGWNSSWFAMLHKVMEAFGKLEPIPWDSNDKVIFTMLDEIILADKEKPLLNSTNMVVIQSGNFVVCAGGLPCALEKLRVRNVWCTQKTYMQCIQFATCTTPRIFTGTKISSVCVSQSFQSGRQWRKMYSTY